MEARTRSMIKLVATFGCFVALAVSVAHVALGHISEEGTSAYIESEYGQVPNVVGMDMRDAWEALVRSGYYPEIAGVTHGDTPGTVQGISVAQMPEGSILGALDPNGVAHPEFNGTEWLAKVTLEVAWVSRIPLQLTAGRTQDQALEELEAAGFQDVEAGLRGEVDPQLNRVISSSPLPGAWASLDTTVQIEVSSEVEMPHIIGMGPVEATGTLTMSGLVPDPAVWAWEGSDERGWNMPTVLGASVDGRSVASGDVLRLGSVVNVEYSMPVEGAL